MMNAAVLRRETDRGQHKMQQEKMESENADGQ